MKISFEEVGQWSATFSCTGVQEGHLVKINGNGSVGVCNAGEAFCGQAVSLSRGGDACAVQLGGFITADYTGDTAPTVSWCGLSADGNGGVKADPTGRSYLVADVDTAAKVVTFVL
jgi:hypothetical protein